MSFLMLVMLNVCFVSCSKDDDANEDQGGGSPGEIRNPSELERKLFNTSWIEYKYEVYKNGTRTLINTNSNYPLYFSSERFNESSNAYKLIYKGLSLDGPLQERTGLWYGTEDDFYLTASSAGLPYSCRVAALTSTNLQLVKEYDSDGKIEKDVWSFKKNTWNPNGNGGNTNADGAPRIGFYDFTATRTSITVRYQIFNKSEANISSATIYYGTSSNPSRSVSASIVGNYITATISGLSKGTEYYVKCKATGGGGSTTTDVVKCITNY